MSINREKSEEEFEATPTQRESSCELQEANELATKPNRYRLTLPTHSCPLMPLPALPVLASSSPLSLARFEPFGVFFFSFFFSIFILGACSASRVVWCGVLCGAVRFVAVAWCVVHRVAMPCVWCVSFWCSCRHSTVVWPSVRCPSAPWPSGAAQSVGATRRHADIGRHTDPCGRRSIRGHRCSALHSLADADDGDGRHGRHSE